jgi:hypothetical protein
MTVITPRETKGCRSSLRTGSTRLRRAGYQSSASGSGAADQRDAGGNRSSERGLTRSPGLQTTSRLQVNFSASELQRLRPIRPPAGTGGDTGTAISIHGGRGCRCGVGARSRVLRSPMNHGQLQHGRTLPLSELCHEHRASIRKFDGIMVTMRHIRVDHAKFSHPEIGRARPDPSVVIFDVLVERQFGPRKQAHRHGGLTF